MAIFKPEFVERVKIKAKHIGNELLSFVPWIAGGMLIGGYFGAIKNGSDIQKINKRLDRNIEIVDNNAACSKYDRRRIDDLERQTNLLMEKAMAITEGKESA